MAKKVKEKFKLIIPAGEAKPVRLSDQLSVKEVLVLWSSVSFNEKTRDKMGFKIPVEITVIDEAFIFKSSSYRFDSETRLGSHNRE